MKPRDPLWLLGLVPFLLYLSVVDGLGGQVDQEQMFSVLQGEVGDFSEGSSRVKRADIDIDSDKADEDTTAAIDDKISSVFHLNNSHLHLMVHWAGKGSSIVFCLARDQVSLAIVSTSNISCLFFRKLVKILPPMFTYPRTMELPLLMSATGSSWKISS